MNKFHFFDKRKYYHPYTNYAGFACSTLNGDWFSCSYYEPSFRLKLKGKEYRLTEKQYEELKPLLKEVYFS